ncbi:unnamed protein product [Thlaspi arvense]|uniref:Pentatricopeptide repeat-containing protein n=1 Tax=Thlaspi arvense TaxID=13288 RepID=A0AAU9R830_THLAR|nr:unnamed protein product [Thlaspi arvense]
MTSAITSRLSRNFVFRRKNLDTTTTHVGSLLSPRFQKLIEDLRSCRDTVEVSRIHGYMVKTGIDKDDFAVSKLIAFSIQDIRYGSSIFQHVSNTNLYMFNAMLRGYSMSDEPERAFPVFNQLRAKGDLSGAESAYGFCIKTGLDLELHLITALIGMFAKIGDRSSARKIFDSAARKDVVTWNCMIDQYAKMGLLEECLWLLRQMKYEKVKPNSSTFVGLLSSCASYEASSIGQSVGDLVEEERIALDAILGTALIDMYAKLGMLDKAVEIFDRMKNKDVKSWTAMISGYGAHGLVREAVTLFYKMEEENSSVKPNEITFLVVLNACSHGGFVMEGIRCFKRMFEVYRFTPKVEHYGCVVDLLGRAGKLEEAYELIKNLPITSDSTAWRALLAACRVYGNADLGERVMIELVEMGERHLADAILLAGTHAVAGNSQGLTKLLDYEFYKEKKEVGYSAIEIE